MLKWLLSVQEALDELTEGVQCTLIFVASRVMQVKRIIPGGNRFPSLWQLRS